MLDICDMIVRCDFWRNKSVRERLTDMHLVIP